MLVCTYEKYKKSIYTFFLKCNIYQKRKDIYKTIAVILELFTNVLQIDLNKMYKNVFKIRIVTR